MAANGWMQHSLLGLFGLLAIDTLAIAQPCQPGWAAPTVQIQRPNGAARVASLTFFDDGRGRRLYAAGAFSFIGGITASSIATFDGTSWAAVAAGVDGTLNAMASFDDGSGMALYVGGEFSVAGATSAANIAKWNGQSWSPLIGGGVDRAVSAICTFRHQDGEALYAGGRFVLPRLEMDRGAITRIADSVRSLVSFDPAATGWGARPMKGHGLPSTPAQSGGINVCSRRDARHFSEVVSFSRQVNDWHAD